MALELNLCQIEVGTSVCTTLGEVRAELVALRRGLASAAAYDDLVHQLQSIEAIEDPTLLYWYVRPSGRFPTLEFRACDVCLRVEDTVTLAGLIRALAWTCAREAIEGQEYLGPPVEVLNAAMWRAARYGLHATLVSPSAMATRGAAHVVGELLAYVAQGLGEHGDEA